jgi:ABC-2 type transport system permease protein
MASGDRSGRLFFELASRRTIPGAVAWALTFGGTVVASVFGFSSAYPTAASRASLAASLGANAGLRALFGPARAIDTVAGFTAWRTLGLASLIGAVWAILVSTKVLRGEEDAGRWELLLSGVTTRGRAAGHSLLGLGVGLGVLYVATAVIITVDGRTSEAQFSVGSSLFFAVALVAAPAMFLGIGALASELGGTRRGAATIGAAALGTCFIAKVIGDASDALHFFIWVSPLGWVEELRPLTGAQPWVLVPIAGVSLCTSFVAVRLAKGRDLGASVFRVKDQQMRLTRWLRGPTSLAARLDIAPALSWFVGLAGLGFLFGLIAKSAATALADSAGVANALRRVVGVRLGATAYLGLMFVIIATVVELAAASQIVAIRDEEASGRLDNLISAGVSTWRWFAGRVLVAASIVIGAAMLAAIAAFFGAVATNTSVSIVGLLQAAINASVAGLVVLGLGLFVYSVYPRAAGTVAYGIVAASYLIEFVGSVIKANHYVLDLSILRHLAPAPAVPLDWHSLGVLLGLATATAVISALRLSRRDLAGA